MSAAAILKTVHRIERRVSALTAIVLAGEDAMSAELDMQQQTLADAFEPTQPPAPPAPPA